MTMQTIIFFNKLWLMWLMSADQFAPSAQYDNGQVVVFGSVALIK